ncbi:hypothetical protein EGH82_12050 [Vibrio ponticus]|uniref:LPP20 lipoprotein n=1 Tax=Vibrio ponticus TaxID=265668 RepID=A0A3N3DZI8_9VIBR|nr:hypothetical protein EGH82_12050 [Vibrio ponticus]
MIKKTLLAASCALLLSACSNIQTVQQGQNYAACTFPDAPTESAPGWVCDISPSDLGISATGYAKKSAAGMSVMKKVALSNAQVLLASQFETTVKNMFKKAVESSETSESGKAGQELVIEKFEDVAENVVSQSLTGARILVSMVSPTGGIYILVGMDQATYNANLNKAIDAVNNDTQLWTQFNSEQAVKDLQQALNSMKQQ